MCQKVKVIKISDLVLWTENPRDPINENASDQDVVDRALSIYPDKWSLHKLAKEMGEHYDFSELPTVVYKNNKPVVYDGNRRVALGKIKHGFVSIKPSTKLNIPEIPLAIPCNVCKESVAVKNIYRKHSNSGSWQPLERDIFLHKFMKEKKSDFMLFNECTELINKYVELNKVFVKDEILTKENLLRLGFKFQDEKLYSVHTSNEADAVLSNLIKKIKDKEISTRKNRGKAIEILDAEIKELLKSNKEQEFSKLSININQKRL